VLTAVLGGEFLDHIKFTAKWEGLEAPHSGLRHPNVVPRIKNQNRIWSHYLADRGVLQIKKGRAGTQLGEGALLP
jgi:hypothetical protein